MMHTTRLGICILSVAPHLSWHGTAPHLTPPPRHPTTPHTTPCGATTRGVGWGGWGVDGVGHAQDSGRPGQDWERQETTAVVPALNGLRSRLIKPPKKKAVDPETATPANTPAADALDGYTHASSLSGFTIPSVEGTGAVTTFQVS